jgi:hypothetical protein
MDLVLRFSFEAQVIAAVVVSVFGYLALFGSLIVCLIIARALYESGKHVWVHGLRSISARRSLFRHVETPAYRVRHVGVPLRRNVGIQLNAADPIER